MADRPDATMKPGTYIQQNYVAAQASATANTVPIFVNDYGVSVVVTRLGFVPRTNNVAHVNKFKFLGVQNRGTAGTSTVRLVSASISTSASGTFTAFNEMNWTLSATAANLVIDDGEVCAMTVTNNPAASGNLLPEGIFNVEFQYV